jgi:predicted DNA-binding transcriptional regulator YafY
MSHPASRVLAMLELLQAHHVLGGRDLAQRLRVDERTVRRYATTLAELGVPVSAARGRYGGYRLRPGYKLPPLMFTDDEAVAVVLGLIAARRLGLAAGPPAATPANPAALAPVESAMAKLRRVLPTPVAGRVAALGDALELTLSRPGRAAPAEAGILLGLGEAVTGRRPVSIDYRSFQGRVSQREVEPYGLVFHAGRWYLTGFDRDRGEIRTFRADRIRTVNDRPGTVTPPAGFDPVEQVTRGLAQVPYAWEVEVLLDADLAAARRRIPPSMGTLAQAPDGVLLRLRAEHLGGVPPMLAGLGLGFTILHPEELRAELVAYAAQLTSHARRTPEAGHEPAGPR